MGKTYFEILKDLDYELGGIIVGYADLSSDSANLYDSSRHELNKDHFNGGRIYIVASDATTNAVGEVREIANTGNTKGQYLPTSPFGADISEGDTYWMVPSFYTLDELKIPVNRVISGMLVPEEDETSLDYDQDVMKYTLPSAIPDPDDLLQVHLMVDTSPVDWVEHTDWKVQQSGYVLIEGVRNPSWFDDRDILLVYASTPDTLVNYTDELHKKIHEDIVIFGAAKKVLFTNLRRAGNDPTTDDRYIYLANEERVAIKRHKIIMPEKPMKPSGFGIV